MFARAALVAGIVTCLSTWLAGAPIPYFDYDDATQGIFVNDLSFRGDLDASFEGRPSRQDRYRVGFAAQRLAFSLPLSWIQRGLGLEHWQVEGLLRAASLVFALGGSLAAAHALLPPPRFGSSERWALVAALSAHPSLALFTRTGFCFPLFAYALFWLGALAAFRWLESERSVWSQLAGGVAALCVLNPYPPLVCWPLAAVMLAAWERRLGSALRSPRLYAAATTALVGAGLATAAMAWAYTGSLGDHLERLAAFRADRGHALGLSQLTAFSPLEKLTKLVNQQLLFRFDRLGDLSRDDRVWTLGTLQPVVLLGALAAAAGLVAALHARTADDRRALVSAGALLLVFLTVSFPEGRYVLVLLPCWAYFALRGLALAAGSTAVRQLALAAGLVLLAGSTEHAIRRTYLPTIQTLWRNFEGMRALAPLLASRPDGGRGIQLGMPYPSYLMPELHFRMLMPDGAEWLPPARFERVLVEPTPGRALASLEYADATGRLARLETRGLRRAAELRGEASGRALLLFLRDPSPGARSR